MYLQPATLRATVFGTLLIGVLVPTATAGELLGAEVWGQARLTSVDRLTAHQTTIGFFGTEGPWGLEYNIDTDTLFLIDGSPPGKGLYTVNRTTGAASRVGVAGALGDLDPRGLAWDSAAGVMYSTRYDTNQILSLDLTTGAVSMSVPMVNFGAVKALAYNGADGQMYAIANVLVGDTGRHLIRFDPTTGIASNVIDLGSGTDSNFRGLTWDPDSQVLWTHNNSTGFLVALDPFDGTVLPIGNTQQSGASGTGLNGLAYVVPSPSGLMAMVFAGSLGAARRRRTPGRTV